METVLTGKVRSGSGIHRDSRDRRFQKRGPNKRRAIQDSRDG